MTDDNNPIITSEDFLAELNRRGAEGCPACRYGGMIAFGLGGELEPLFLITKSQITGQRTSLAADNLSHSSPPARSPAAAAVS